MAMIVRLLFSFALLGASHGGGIGSTTIMTFVPPTSLLATTTTQLAVVRLRGGGSAGPIADVAGKVLATAGLIQGAAMTLAPEPNTELYELNKDNPLVNLLMENYGSYTLGTGVILYSLLFKGSRTNTAIGAGFMVLVLHGYKCVLNDVAGKFDMNKAGLLFNVATLAFTTYALLTGQDYADKMATYISYYGLLNGVFSVIAPERFATLWGLKEADVKAEDVPNMQRALGYCLTAFCTLTLTLLGGADPLQGCGYFSAITTISLLHSVYVDKQNGKPRGARLYPWILFHAVIAATTLLSSSSSSSAPIADA